MNVSTALLCDFAIVREGLLHVISGGVTRLWRDQYPAALGCSLALVFEVHPMELGRPHELEVRVLGEDGAEIATVQGGFQTAPGPDTKAGESMVVPMAFDIRGAGLPGPGGYSIEISVDGTHHRTLSFWSQPRGGQAPQLDPGS